MFGNEDLERIVIRARRIWDHNKGIPLCPNEAAAEAEGRPLFSSVVPYDSSTDPFVQYDSASQLIDHLRR